MKRTNKTTGKAPGGPAAELTPGPGVGRSIRVLRASEGLTQAELGLAAGVNRANISAYENDRRRPRPATLARIAAAAGSRPSTIPGGPAVAASIAERVRVLAEAALGEVAARLAAGIEKRGGR